MTRPLPSPPPEGRITEWLCRVLTHHRTTWPVPATALHKAVEAIRDPPPTRTCSSPSTASTSSPTGASPASTTHGSGPCTLLELRPGARGGVRARPRAAVTRADLTARAMTVGDVLGPRRTGPRSRGTWPARAPGGVRRVLRAPAGLPTEGGRPPLVGLAPPQRRPARRRSSRSRPTSTATAGWARPTPTCSPTSSPCSGSTPPTAPTSTPSPRSPSPPTTWCRYRLAPTLRSALLGHLAGYEMTSVTPMSAYARAARRLHLGPAVERFYDVHVEADEHHGALVFEPPRGRQPRGRRPLDPRHPLRRRRHVGGRGPLRPPPPRLVGRRPVVAAGRRPRRADRARAPTSFGGTGPVPYAGDSPRSWSAGHNPEVLRS